MPIASPETTAANLWAEVNELVTDTVDLRQDDLRTRALERKIRGLMNVDALAAHMLSGTVYQLTGAFEAMKDEFRIAKRLSSKAKVYTHYMTCLLNTGFFSEAHEEARVAGDPRNGDFCLNYSRLLSLGAVRLASQFLVDADKMGLSRDVEPANVAMGQDALRVMIENGLEDQDLAAILDLFGSAMREMKVLFWAHAPIVRVWHRDDVADVQSHIEFRLIFAKGPAFVGDLEERFTELVVDSASGGHLPAGVVVTTGCASPIQLAA